MASVVALVEMTSVQKLIQHIQFYKIVIECNNVYNNYYLYYKYLLLQASFNNCLDFFDILIIY